MVNFVIKSSMSGVEVVIYESENISLGSVECDKLELMYNKCDKTVRMLLIHNGITTDKKEIPVIHAVLIAKSNMVSLTLGDLDISKESDGTLSVFPKKS